MDRRDITNVMSLNNLLLSMTITFMTSSMTSMASTLIPVFSMLTIMFLVMMSCGLNKSININNKKLSFSCWANISISHKSYLGNTSCDVRLRRTCVHGLCGGICLLYDNPFLDGVSNRLTNKYCNFSLDLVLILLKSNPQSGL